ncbi:hypothetical protein HYH02_006662 [Chlamydomonas schloesseri]|uniref:Uncharacterized protein n=1 Tax=Chlamydomonas schloesseri TaxID=2026947 RepID=A0A835SWA4_9CHLO|nr:hypothetical protein HYH02_006662 [Chlamydomonas schloesseri]|eukprot:KAG2432677.1 hypothetical protein HYH02_006662 [Chlamydomonas schloesseri]
MANLASALALQRWLAGAALSAPQPASLLASGSGAGGSAPCGWGARAFASGGGSRSAQAGPGPSSGEGAATAAAAAGQRDGARPSVWASFQRALFPIGSASSGEAAAPSSSAPSSASTSAPSGRAAVAGRGAGGTAASASVAADARMSARAAQEARNAARRAAKQAGAAQSDAFAGLSKPAEAFSATLLKAAVLLITVPLGVHMMSHSLMLSLCVKGLESDRPETVVLTLKRIRSVVASDYLAARFEAEEGVALLLTCFNERAGEGILREFLAAAQQLLQFKSTREALLMSSLVERLERAQAAGWLPPGLREPARQLYLDAHAARRMEMEAGGGAAAGGS